MSRLTNLLKASEIHNNIKSIILSNLDTNMTLIEFRNHIHNLILTELDKLTDILSISKGLAFPIGLSADCIVAHYTPIKLSNNEYLPYYLNPQSKLSEFKILKVDYGIQIEGNIIDKAFSINICNNVLISKLIEGSSEAVTKIKHAIGVDVRLNELADMGREIVESYEFNDKPLKIVENVYSHNVEEWKIHGDKFIRPDYSQYNEDYKVSEGEQYAIEIYVSNGCGKGKLVENPSIHSHYRLKKTHNALFFEDSLNKMIEFTNDKLKGLPFCPNIINSYNFKINKKKPSHPKILSICQMLQSNDIMESYPPIIECDESSYVAQIEEDVFINDSETTIFV